MKVKYDSGAYPLVREHSTDAGADIRTPINLCVPAHGNVFVDTGIHIQLPSNTVGMIKSKSGLNVKKNIVSEGVIDEGFTGSIGVKLYNHGEDDVCFLAGDKISQLVVLPCFYPMFIEGEFEETERGENGFGSTGV